MRRISMGPGLIDPITLVKALNAIGIELRR